MIGVVADVLEVVVLAAGADAFLGVGRARRVVRGFFHAEEIRYKRIHPGIGEQQARRLRQQRGGRHNGVLLFTEKIQETLADGGGSHGHTCQTMNRPAWHGKYFRKCRKMTRRKIQPAGSGQGVALGAALGTGCGWGTTAG
jgi:hypothetical protein